MGRTTRINRRALHLPALPKNPNPSTARRGSKAGQKLRTITGAINGRRKKAKVIAGKKAIAIFIGLGSTADEDLVSTFFAVRKLSTQKGIAVGK